MKINPFANVIPFSSAVRSKRSEGDGGSARQQYDPNQNRKDDEQKDKKQEPFDPKLIDDAVESFKADEVTRASGLSATVEGVGPGLKIHVKDCNGTTLRQFSTEEFLRLRDATSKGAGKRGKILDQKL